MRAQRAAADPSYPVAAQQEFAAIESTAADALHELRLVLRALRSNEDEHTDHEHTAAGLGTVVLDLEESVRAVADDLSASGYSVTYQCRETGTTLAFKLPSSPGASGDVLQCSETCGSRSTGHHHLESRRSQARLVVTNGVLSSHHRFPSSGMGILGMKERLSTVGAHWIR